MKLKRKWAQMEGLRPEMWYYLGMVDSLFKLELDQDLVVTNAVAKRRYPSKHTEGNAIDGRTRDYYDFETGKHHTEFRAVINRIRQTIDPMGFDTVLEPDMLTEDNLRVRFTDKRLKELIGHTNRDRITLGEFNVLRKAIPPHFHGEWDPKAGEVLAALTD